MRRFFSTPNVHSLARALRSATRSGLQLLVLLLALTSHPATAIAQQAQTGAPPTVRTVTLDVKGMFCALCSKTVSKALGKVPGVKEVKVNLDTNTAVVTFDSAKTDIPAITKATTNAGFPSTAKP